MIKNFYKPMVQVAQKRIYLIENSRIFHHRLSIGLFNKLDNYLMNLRLNNFIKQKELAESETVVINFIYDYAVRLKSKMKVYTFLNDDFEFQTKIFNLNYKREYILKNIRASGRLITVSPFLTEKYRKVPCRKWEILPWVSDIELRHVDERKISQIPKPNRIIFFGFINQRLDFELINQLANEFPQFHIDFFGEISRVVEKEVKKLRKKFENLHFYNAVDFQDIDFSKYLCSITPYCGHSSDQVVYATNKLFRLAAAGLPSVSAGLPGLVKHTSVVKVETIDEFASALNDIAENIVLYQKSARELARENSEDKAWEKWIAITND